MVYEVLLGIDTEPAFPPECIVCHAASPGHAFRYVTRDAMRGRQLWAGWLTRRVPACPPCGLRVQLAHAGRFIRTLIVALGPMALTVWLLHDRLEELACGLVSFGVVCVFVLALVLWERRHPPVFSIALDGSDVTYRFRDPALAARFALANGLTIENVVKD